MSTPPQLFASESDLALARVEVIAWLRDGAVNNDPMFMLGHPEVLLEQKHGEIADRFLDIIKPSGFRLEVFSTGDDGPPGFDSRWTHRDADFVGFKQPAPAQAAEDTKLLACAALLRNDWCRQRLKVESA